MKVQITAIVAALATLAIPTVAGAASSVTRSRAEAVTKRAASREAGRYGVSLPPSAWKAVCYRARFGEWRCEAGAGGGECSAGMYVVPDRRGPLATLIRVYCFD